MGLDLSAVDAGDAIAAYAAVVSTGTAIFGFYSWRRVPESLIEFRQVKVDAGADKWAISAIAANRSPHEVELREASVRCRLTGFRSVQRFEQPGGVSVEHTQWVRGASAELGFAGISISLGTAVGDDLPTDLSLALEAPLQPEHGPFPLKIPTGQGRGLLGGLAMTDELRPLSGYLRLEAMTNDGRTFTDDVRLPAGAADSVSWAETLKE